MLAKLTAPRFFSTEYSTALEDDVAEHVFVAARIPSLATVIWASTSAKRLFSCPSKVLR
ncbi:unnamed protein product [Haemonchus placei]|uniref:Uncharacterized protein n=1 Tax=Haemonchus placei TaxID=6290 RepID=A0A3P7W010_HAEPC|nr:unnamed protein product [Haemonchus placei]